jgi:PAS domain S-box-containing protein
MSEAELRRQIAALTEQNGQLLQRAATAEQKFDAFARGEIDSVALDALTTPLLLQAAQEDLRRSAQLLRGIFNGALDAMLLADDEGRYVDANPAACRLFGLAHEQLMGRNLTQFAAPGYDGAAAYKTFRETGRMRGQFPFVGLDGTRRVLDYSAAANVAPGLHLSVLRDISDQIETERARHAAVQALRESRDQLEEAQAIAHIGNWTAGIGAHTELRWSRECYRMFGVPDGTPMTVGAFFMCVHPEDRGRVIRASRAATEPEHPSLYDVEHRVLRPDGTVRRVHERALVEQDAENRATRIFGTVQDITDRHAAVEALRASEERYRRIIEATSEGVWIYDAQGITTFMNVPMAEMLGCTVEETLGQPIYNFIDASKRPEAEARADRRRQGKSERGDFCLRRKDGAELWVSAESNPLYHATGRFEGGLVMVTDISMRRRADEARARLAAIVESSDDAIISVSLDGLIASWNLGAKNLYQYSPEEIVGKPVTLLIPTGFVEDERRILARAAQGAAVRQYETQRLRKDGSVVEVAVTISPVRDTAGNVIGVSKIARDLTPRREAEIALRRTEEQFRQAQKMEAVGRLAGGVAHDFNNLLSVILSYAGLAVDTLKVGDPLRGDLEQIEIAGNRATELTRQLLAFSRQQVLQPRVLDLNQIVAGMKPMLTRLLGEDIDLAAVAASDLFRVLADPGQVEQVVMNLAVNARDAMPNGGKLTIETANVELSPDDVAADVGVQAGHYAMLAVSDTGVGMDAATRARIFEPFFTTKDKGKGTGLGLSTVFGIVQQSGGHVGVYSEPGQGCTFKVYLPATDRVAEAPVAATMAAVLHGSETILLVEDEPQVRAVECSILRRHGYHVLETSNGGEAFLIAREFAGRIHLMLTDVVMPRMSGRVLAQELAAQRPDMKVLFASGYTDDAIVHHGVLNAGVAFLQKPFTPDALLRKIREVLDGPVPSGRALAPVTDHGWGTPSS